MELWRLVQAFLIVVAFAVLLAVAKSMILAR